MLKDTFYFFCLVCIPLVPLFAEKTEFNITTGCRSDSSCDPGEICENGKCIEGCLADYDCPFDKACINRRCIDPCSVPETFGRDAESRNCLGEWVRALLVGAPRDAAGGVDVSALLTRGVEDPTPLAPFNASSEGFLTDVAGSFTELWLHGLSGFQLDGLRINLADMNLSAAFRAPMLSVVGRYVLDGSITFLAISGDGPFSLNMSDIRLQGHSVVSSSPRMRMGDVVLNSEVGEVAVHFENLMGGGTWGSISNSLLNQLSEIIVGELKPTLLAELSAHLRRQFDAEVFARLPAGFADPRSAGLLDWLLMRASDHMLRHGLDPLPLPDYRQSFEQSLLFVTTRGVVRVHNGTLRGLSTLGRKGDVVASFHNDSLVLEAAFQFQNLTGDYLWGAQAFGAQPGGSLEVQVKALEGFVRIKQDMQAGSRLTIEDLQINGIRHIWLDLQGLGTWDYVMESVVNLLTNGLKLQLADAIAEPVKESIQQQLDQLNIGIPD